MHAIGSSYLIRQSPGAERFDGATATIRLANTEPGTIEIKLNDWRTLDTIDDDAEFLRDAAQKAIVRFAEHNLVDLPAWDITIDRFAYHPVDSGPKGTYDAVYNALASAFASWSRVTLDLPGMRQNNPMNPSGGSGVS